jgi:hypothetical protein
MWMRGLSVGLEPAIANGRHRRPNESGALIFGITVRPVQTIGELAKNPDRPEATLSTGRITGGRKVVILKSNQGKGSCAASIEVGSGRIDIDGQTLRGTTEDSCSVVNRVADFVEPRLPAA